MALGGHGAWSTLGHGSVSHRGRPRRLAVVGIGHRLPHPATAGLALVTQRQGNDRIGGTGASAHHALWIAGPGTATVPAALGQRPGVHQPRSEETTSELQSLMRISYAVFCLKKKTNKIQIHSITCRL